MEGKEGLGIQCICCHPHFIPGEMQPIAREQGCVFDCLQTASQTPIALPCPGCITRTVSDSLRAGLLGSGFRQPLFCPQTMLKLIQKKLLDKTVSRALHTLPSPQRLLGRG